MLWSIIENLQPVQDSRFMDNCKTWMTHYLLKQRIGISLAPQTITDIYIFVFPIYRYFTNEKRRDNLNHVQSHIGSNLSQNLRTILWVRFSSFSCYVMKMKLCVVVFHHAHFILHKVWPAEWYEVFDSNSSVCESEPWFGWYANTWTRDDTTRTWSSPNKLEINWLSGAALKKTLADHLWKIPPF